MSYYKEWTGKRPFSWAFGNNRHRRGKTTQSHKQMLHGVERAQERQLVLDEMQEYYEGVIGDEYDASF